MESVVSMDLSFYNGKRVLITGHTGFKGTWMCKVLKMLGAEIIGYALDPPTSPNLFTLTNMSSDITSIIGDIRDMEVLNTVFNKYAPEIVIHMAAQPIVREGYKNPVYTYAVNVMGTVNILEIVRTHRCVQSFVNVTTDKVYRNNEWSWGYRETDILDGYDPYSNSKSCSELVTASYQRSFFKETNTAISTCRAGNVIGGGDFAIDRILPDCIRSIQAHRDIVVRNPFSIRPYQHVLEPVCAYLKVAQLQYLDKDAYAGSYNIGPEDTDCVTTGKLVELFCQKWGGAIRWRAEMETNAPHEAGLLRLDNSHIKQTLGWKPIWNIVTAIEKCVEWSKVYLESGDANRILEKQILEYLSLQ